MFKHASAQSCKLPAWFALFVGFIFPAAVVADARVSETYGKLPLHFEANHGQTHGDVRFLARGPGYSLYLTASEAVLVLSKRNENEERNARGAPGQLEAPAKPVMVRMSLVGAASRPRVSGIEKLPGKANYFIGNDPEKWRTNVPTYTKVHYQDVYPGIDLVYYGNQRQLEYDFVLAAGADPKRIVLGFKGAEKLEIDARGNLVLHASGGTIHQKRPVIYQEIDGVRTDIDGAYVLKGPNRVGFKLAPYDTSRPLVIDPVLSYSTYLGGSGWDQGEAIAVDSDGNAYVTGAANSTNFPTTPGTFQPARAGGPYDAFVAKINPTGTGLVYSTYLGGDGHFDVGNAITVDALGNAYIVGATESINFPTTIGVVQPVFGGGRDDAFLAKLSPTGSELIYSTYLGGAGSEYGHGVAVDAAGNAYMTGYSGAINYPTTPGAFQPLFAGGGSDVIVTKVNPSGSALVYSTYVGGSVNTEVGFHIAIDTDGNAYVTGVTYSIDFPTTLGVVQPLFAGGPSDAFVMKLNPMGSSLVYSTFLGGDGEDEGRGIAVDAAGNAYATGETASINFPTTLGTIQPGFGGGPSDVFVTKLNSKGSELIYSTYLGGSGGDGGFGIATDAVGNTYVVGQTNSANFPVTSDAFQGAFAGGAFDAFVTMLNPTASAVAYSSFLGGTDRDYGSGIALGVSADVSVYVTGGTASTGLFPITAGAFQSSFGGGFHDAFVARITNLTQATPTTRFEESAATYTGNWPTYGPKTGTFSGGTLVASNTLGSTATFSFTGPAVSWIGAKCNVCGVATVSINGGPPTKVDTFGPAAPGSLKSEVVFSATGLAPHVSHTMVITVTGVPTSVFGLLTGDSLIAVDAFDVAR
jgi:hypothetical protein